MTRDEYRSAARRVTVYGNGLGFLTIALTFIPGAVWLDAHPSAGAWLNEWLGHYIPGEAVRGLVGGLGVVATLIPLFVPPLVVFWWVDRRLGLRCPSCGRSVTFRSKYVDVLTSGRCGLCQAVLFEPGPAEPLFRPVPPEELAEGIALWGVVLGLACAGLRVAFHSIPSVRAIGGLIGFMSAAIGGGVALWCGVRLRTWRCLLGALLSILCFAAWGWIVWALIHGRDR
jgi:hypothetical protein